MKKKCIHDPDDGGDTCCNCGKVLTEAELMEYEVRLRARAKRTAKRMAEMADRFFKDMPLPRK